MNPIKDNNNEEFKQMKDYRKCCSSCKEYPEEKEKILDKYL
jgi:hypothetical protein